MEHARPGAAKDGSGEEATAMTLTLRLWSCHAMSLTSWSRSFAWSVTGDNRYAFSGSWHMASWSRGLALSRISSGRDILYWSVRRW